MDKKNLILISFLLANSLVWHYTARNFVSDVTANFETSERIFINAMYYLSIVIASIIGALLSTIVNKNKLFLFWMTLGCVSSAIPFMIPQILEDNLMVITTILLGLSFGIGMPSCLAAFAELTNFRNRGLVGGLTLLGTNLGAVILAYLSGETITRLAILLVLRIAGLCTLLSITYNFVNANEEKASSFFSILQNKTFLLYVIPWLIFCIVDRFERIFCEAFFEQSFFKFAYMVEPAIGTCFVLLGGLLADRIGRKRVTIFGFVALGLGYASIGMAPYMSVSRYFYIIMDGAAWGIFMTLFVLVLWGDIASVHSAAEKYYTVGSIPFFLSDLLVALFGHYIKSAGELSAYAIFSLASFFLFLAVVPLMFAPETLPEKVIRERELRRYIERAKRVRERFTKG